MKIILIILAFTITGFFSASEAQNPRSHVKQDENVDLLIRSYRQYNQSRGMQGFRVQIYTASGNRSKLLTERQKAEFDASFPGVRSEISYDEPYWKLRVGDFRTRLEAERFRREISSRYILALVVPDRINLPRLAETDQ